MVQDDLVLMLVWLRAQRFAFRGAGVRIPPMVRTCLVSLSAPLSNAPSHASTSPPPDGAVCAAHVSLVIVRACLHAGIGGGLAGVGG